MPTLYASFANLTDAERAAAALLDHGALSTDITILASERYANHGTQDALAASSEVTAKEGLSVTTAGDAAYGAVKGSMVGLGVGTVAALAAMLVPGIGFIIGGGTLALAAGGALATTAAGAAAGGVVGLLKDQGVGEHYVTRYSQAIHEGGCLLSVHIPTGEVTEVEAEQLMAKYGASDVSMVGGDRALTEPEEVIVEEHVPTRPIAVEVIEEEVVEPVTRTTLTTTPSNPGAVVAAANAVDVEPTRINPVTGAMVEGVVVDPVTGQPRVVEAVSGTVIESVEQPTAAPGFTLADIRPTETDAVTGEVVAGTITDPVTGEERRVRVVNGAIIYADVPPRGNV